MQPNKNGLLNCPFHQDKTASLQVNVEKNFYKNHACDKKGDVIQWVQDYGNLTKHEAILKCTTMVEELNPRLLHLQLIIHHLQRILLFLPTLTR